MMALAASTNLNVQKIENFNHCIQRDNGVMSTALLLLCTALMASFGFSEHLSISIQISAHILTILSVAAFKVGYVIRCVGAHNLGHKAF
jgi:hypothetical protein